MQSALNTVAVRSGTDFRRYYGKEKGEKELRDKMPEVQSKAGGIRICGEVPTVRIYQESGTQ